MVGLLNGHRLLLGSFEAIQIRENGAVVAFLDRESVGRLVRCLIARRQLTRDVVADCVVWCRRRRRR